jgi:hypothetical protein
MELTKQILLSLITETLKEAVSGAGLHDLVMGSSLYDIEKKNGLKRLLTAAYISGQRNEPIAGLQEENPWFESFDELQNEWNRGRQWAKKQKEWDTGLSDGSKTARRLVAKGEVQTEKGIRKYIAIATRNRSESYQKGYKLGFELNMSKTLGEPIPDGQQHFANARPSQPSQLFNRPRGGKNPLSTLEEEASEKPLDNKRKIK